MKSLIKNAIISQFMKLYISDLHFFHDRIIELDQRNFPDSHTMNKFMLEQWNSKVKGGDIVIVLGDMFASKNPDEVNVILNRLNGKICLIEGNHDKMWLKKEGINLNRFEWIKQYTELTDGNYNVILSHYPTFCYNHQYLVNQDETPRTFMLYGHVHNTIDEALVNQFQEITRKTPAPGTANKTIPCNMINCFCKFSNYVPLSLEEWISLDKKRRLQLLQKN